jgi:HK97 family phage major capsid protein
MREKLLALMKAKNERKAAIVKQADTVTEVEELRKLNKELDGVNEEIRKLQEMLDEFPEVVDPTKIADPDGRTAAVNGEIPGAVKSSAKAQEQRKAPDEEGMEYRKAFQQFVTKGTPIPAELRADANTLTTDIAAVLPPITVNRIVEKLETTGMILPLITRTAFAAGIKIPTSSVKPVATFVGEGQSSDRQKKTTGTSITFTNFKLRCEISMSMEASTMALSAFEAAFERQVVEAMVKAIESKIISTADGTASPKGILAETPAEGQALTASALNYQLLVDAEAAIPQAYESGAIWCMTKKTFMGFIGMVDSQKQPIARVNYGIGGAPERTLLGRSVVLCGDYMDSYSTSLEAGKIFAFIFNFKDYALNTIYDMGVQRKQDWDTEDMITKAVMSVDGKVIDKNSLVTLAVAAAG